MAGSRKRYIVIGILTGIVAGLTILYGVWSWLTYYLMGEPNSWVQSLGFDTFDKLGSDPSYREAGEKAGRMLMLAVSLVALGIGKWVSDERRRTVRKSLYGDAKFATERDIRNQHLRDSAGVILGDANGRLLRYDGDGFILMSAGPGSGKSVGLVIPNLLNWPHSVITVDSKGELYEYSAGYRASVGHRVLRFSPANLQSCSARLNPLDTVPRDPVQRIQPIELLVSILVERKGGSNPMWFDQAEHVVKVVICAFMDLGGPVTLGMVSRFLYSQHVILKFKAISEDARFSYTVREWAGALTQIPGGTLMGILTQAQTAVKPWQNPLIDRVTSASDWDWQDLKARPTSLYLSIDPGPESERLQPLVRFFYASFVASIVRQGSEDAAKGQRILLMLDEFAELGELMELYRSVAYLRGYGVQFVVIIQSMAQLERLYGGSTGRREFMDMFKHWVFFNINDAVVANDLSKMMGQKTFIDKQPQGLKHKPQDRLIAQPLMTPNDLRQLSEDRQVVLTQGGRPVLGNKLKYYEDRRFEGRLLPPPAVKSAAWGVHPAEDEMGIDEAVQILLAAGNRQSGQGTKLRPGTNKKPGRDRSRGQQSKGNTNEPSPTDAWSVVTDDGYFE